MMMMILKPKPTKPKMPLPTSLRSLSAGDTAYPPANIRISMPPTYLREVRSFGGRRGASAWKPSARLSARLRRSLRSRRMPWGRCSWTWFTCDRGNLAQEWPQVCLSNTQGPSAAPVWLRQRSWPQPRIYAAAHRTRQPLDRARQSFCDARRPSVAAVEGPAATAIHF